MARNKGFTPDEIQAKMKELQDAGVKNASASDALAVLTVEGRIASKTAKEADGDGKSGETARERTRRLAGAKATKSKSASSEKSKDDGKQPEEAKEAEEASSVEHTQGEFIAWIPRDPKDGGPFGFVKIANGDRKGQEAYANTRAFVSSEDANKMSQQGHGAMAIFDLKEHDDSRLAASNVVILNWGDAWPRHEKGDGNRMGSENNPIVVAINGPVKILSALSVLEQGGISITPDTYVTGTCLCGNPWLVQVKVVHGMGAAGLDQMRCGPCYKKVKGKPAIWRFRRDQNEDDGQRQQMRPPDRQKAPSATAPEPERRKGPAEEAKTRAKTILVERGLADASIFDAMVVLLQGKAAASNEAEAKALVDKIWAEIEEERRQAAEAEIQKWIEAEMAKIRCVTIYEAATAYNEDDLNQMDAILTLAGLSPKKVYLEVVNLADKMAKEQARLAAKRAADERQQRIQALAEVAFKTAQEAEERPEDAMAATIMAAELEFDEKIEASTMANTMWAKSQQPEESAEEEEAEEAAEVETVPASAERPDGDEVAVEVPEWIMNGQRPSDRLLQAMGIPPSLSQAVFEAGGYEPGQNLPWSSVAKTLGKIAKELKLSSKSSQEDYAAGAQRLFEAFPLQTSSFLSLQDASGQLKKLNAVIAMANAARAEADLAAEEGVESKDDLASAYAMASSVQQLTEETLAGAEAAA